MNAPLLPALPGYSDPELIAHGTTALVFRATQTALNRPVAIKVITADTNAGSIPVNVERELATTVALSSQPHIVSIIDTGVTPDDRRYIVMEYCEGGSYAQILRQRGPLPVDDVIEVGIKIGQALHAAHEVGIVHRDVKPSNILRSRFGPALTDFGIARAPDELSSTLTREMMTPHHASPEALLHQAQSGLSDVYSLASTMWTLLVGHPPFVDPKRPDVDMYQFRDRVLHEPLPEMTREDVPEWLVAELRRAMAKLPAQRHGSALEFSEALQRGALGLAPAPTALSEKPDGPVIVRPPATDDEPVRHSPGLPAEAWPVPSVPVSSAPVPSGPISTPPDSSAPVLGALATNVPVSEAPAPDTAGPGTPVSGTPVSGTPVSGTPTSGAPVSDTPVPPSPRRPVIGQPATSAAVPAAPARTPAPVGQPTPPAPVGSAPSVGPAEPPSLGRATPPPASPAPSAVAAAPPAPTTPPASSAPPAPSTLATPPAPSTLATPPAPSALATPPAPSALAAPLAPPATARPAGPTSTPASPPAPPVPAPSGPAPSAPTPSAPAPPAPLGPGDDGPIYRPRPVPASAPVPATHPLGDAPTPAPPPVVEQDGWLPRPDESAQPEWPAPSPTRAEPRPYRDAVTAPSGGRRGGLLAVLAGVVVIAVASGLLLFLSRGGQPEDPPDPGANAASPSVTVSPTLITAGTEGAPTDVRITEDRGTSVTVAWTAPAGGPQSYVAVAYLAGSNEPLDVHTIPGGQAQMTVTFTDLDATENYCFAIGVLYSVSEVAPATVCTVR